MLKSFITKPKIQGTFIINSQVIHKLKSTNRNNGEK